jgi:diacylglycerol kinase
MRTQQNAWIHATASLIVFALCLWVGIPPRDWAVIILAVAMVFSAEFVNTAIEAVVDLASPVHHPLAKVGKDVGAAAVLVAASAAFLIGLMIIGPPLWGKVSGWFGGPSPVSRAEQTAFKGMELYSWSTDGSEWQYAILIGTNRNKTLAEVQAAPLDLQGVKAAMSQMAVGESLFWLSSVFDPSSSETVNMPLPPQDVVRELQEFALENQINLIVP